jgi:hypothetical protein
MATLPGIFQACLLLPFVLLKTVLPAARVGVQRVASGSLQRFWSMKERFRGHTFGGNEDGSIIEYDDDDDFQEPKRTVKKG